MTKPKPTSTPRVATYFFSNSPVRCLFTKVVFPETKRIKDKLNRTTKFESTNLTGASVPHQHQLEGGHVLPGSHPGYIAWI